MPTNSEQTETPEARAEAAARDLVDTGRNVTARAVREAAGVRMAVAAEAARAWRDAVANEPEVIVPPVPEDVGARLNAIWADSYRAAVSAMSPERDRLERRVKDLEDEVEKTIAEVTKLEEDKERAELELGKANTLAQKAQALADTSVREASEAESRSATAEAERNRIEATMTALIERIPALREDEA